MSVKPQKRDDRTPRQKPGGQTEGEKNLADRTPDAHDLSETDLAADKMGNNRLQGDDQLNVHNERHAQAEAKTETDSVMEGLERRERRERRQEESKRKKE